MIRVVHPGSGSWFFTHPGYRTPNPGVKKHQIPDPQHCFRVFVSLYQPFSIYDDINILKVSPLHILGSIPLEYMCSVSLIQWFARSTGLDICLVWLCWVDQPPRLILYINDAVTSASMRWEKSITVWEMRRWYVVMHSSIKEIGGMEKEICYCQYKMKRSFLADLEFLF